MGTLVHHSWSRRRFLRGLAIAGGAGLLAFQSEPAAAEPPLETTTIRLIFDPEIPVLCYAPQYVAEEFLRIEGFTDIGYVPYAADASETSVLVAGNADLSAALNADLVVAIDAIGAFPPMSYDLHARKIGHVILNTTTDEPWRYYFCCMVAARREFVQQYPIATKRALRALLKANQLCSLEPQRMARLLVERGYEPS